MSGISIIIPVLNEGASIKCALARLATWRAAGHEVIVVDGGSTDDTLAMAAGGCDCLLTVPRGRARQMNAGAARASHPGLLFLHADTRLPGQALDAVQAALVAQQWGRFDVRLCGRNPSFRIIERLMSLRSRWSGVATGDQAIFVRRTVFREVGGYPPIPLMEDVALSKVLRRRGRPACLRLAVETSTRRWESGGIARTVALMWGLRTAYALGVPPARLANFYRNHGAP